MLDKSESDNITEFCNLIGVNRRFLERYYKSFIGMSPKRYQKVNRVQKAIVKMISRNYLKLGLIGYDCGYYNQSHFIHDFKSFTGMLPGQFYNEKTVTAEEGKHIFSSNRPWISISLLISDLAAADQYLFKHTVFSGLNRCPDFPENLRSLDNF